MITKLFVYGQLQHDIDPPKTLVRWRDDSVMGEMYNRGDDPALLVHKNRILGEPYACHGELLTMDSRELDKIDREELQAGYKRIRIQTLSNARAYVYVYFRHIPSTARKINRWHS